MAARAEILKKDRDSGLVYLREGVTAAFFLPTPMDACAVELQAAFEAYLAMVPPGALKWAAVGSGSEEWKPVAKNTFDRCRAQLKPEAVRKRPITSFELTDGDQGGQAPGYGLLVIGNPFDPEVPDEKSLLQAHFPAEVLADANREAFVSQVRELAALLPFVSGYVSPGLHWAEIFKAQALKQARAVTRRHPGFDVQDNARARTYLGTHVRGARWLTFLGPELAGQLGGADALRGALPEDVSIETVGHGLMIRAGDAPEIGDASRKVDTPLLRAVAAALEPVTLFGELALYGSEFADQDDDLLEAYERRFLD